MPAIIIIINQFHLHTSGTCQFVAVVNHVASECVGSPTLKLFFIWVIQGGLAFLITTLDFNLNFATGVCMLFILGFGLD